MNLRRWLPRRGPLVVATLAMAATVIAPAPAAAATTYIYCSPYSFFGPDLGPGGTTVSADVRVTCSGGAASYISGWLQILRDGTVVASTNSIGYIGVTAHTSASCVPGNYVVATWGSVSYPIDNIPGFSSWSQQSPSVYIDCVARPVVAFPGNQSMFQYDSGYLQMTATGATPPYTWSATGLPPGLSINASTGLISGVGTTVGTYTVGVTARDTAGGSGSTQFTWRVRREPCPRC
jgi:hypothetical protein